MQNALVHCVVGEGSHGRSSEEDKDVEDGHHDYEGVVAGMEDVGFFVTVAPVQSETLCL